MRNSRAFLDNAPVDTFIYAEGTGTSEAILWRRPGRSGAQLIEGPYWASVATGRTVNPAEITGYTLVASPVTEQPRLTDDEVKEELLIHVFERGDQPTGRWVNWASIVDDLRELITLREAK